MIPVFIFAPEEEQRWRAGAASLWWLHHSLTALAAALKKSGSGLVIQRGPSLAALRRIASETAATLLCWNKLYEPAALRRDALVAAALEKDDLSVAQFNSSLLCEPGTILNGQRLPYRVFTPFWRSVEQNLATLAPPSKAPLELPPLQRGLDSLALDDLQLLPKIAWDAGLAQTWTPGEHGALQQLKRFTRHVADYPSDRDRPDLERTSRLSPHLHFGEIGPRQIFAALRAGLADNERSGATRTQGVNSYLRQIGWREFAHHLLVHFPHTTEEPLDARFARQRWDHSRANLRAWQRGHTGIPIVDAGMRELWHTGWMHNRVRMIVASLLTKNLQIHWLSGARWFWDTLVDADLANNTLGWQWVAGCGADAAPYYRIFNPVLQTERFDPERRYIRRWVPEIASLPDRWIHQPWAAPQETLQRANIVLGKTYARPLIDLSESRARALEAYSQIKA